MKVGDYVRIKWGNGLQTISKCKNIVNMGDTQYAKDDYYIHTDHSGEVIYKTMIIKSSPNIIDLVEVGDYVDGRYIQKIKKIENNEMTCMLDSDYEFYSYIKNEDIRTIITKEQFESMEYKVGSDKE